MTEEEKQKLRSWNIAVLVEDYRHDFLKKDSWRPGNRKAVFKSVYTERRLKESYDLLIHFLATNRLYLKYAP